MIKYLNFKRDIMSELLFLQNSIDGGPGTLIDVAEKNGISFEVADASKGRDFPDPRGYGAVVMLGYKKSVNEQTESMKHKIHTVGTALDYEIPYFGICLGHQVAAKALDGDVYESSIPETGFVDRRGEPYQVSLTEAGKADPLFKGLPNPFRVFETHNDIVRASNSMTVIGEGQRGNNQVIKYGEAAYGLQPHIELTDEMFAKWSMRGPLSKIGADTLIAQANDPEIDYRRTGEILFTNFLKIAKIL